MPLYFWYYPSHSCQSLWHLGKIHSLPFSSFPAMTGGICIPISLLSSIPCQVGPCPLHYMPSALYPLWQLLRSWLPPSGNCSPFHHFRLQMPVSFMRTCGFLICPSLPFPPLRLLFSLSLGPFNNLIPDPYFPMNFKALTLRCTIPPILSTHPQPIMLYPLNFPLEFPLLFLHTLHVRLSFLLAYRHRKTCSPFSMFNHYFGCSGNTKLLCL